MAALIVLLGLIVTVPTAAATDDRPCAAGTSEVSVDSDDDLEGCGRVLAHSAAAAAVASMSVVAAGLTARAHRRQVGQRPMGMLVLLSLAAVASITVGIATLIGGVETEGALPLLATSQIATVLVVGALLTAVVPKNQNENAF